MVAQKQTKIIGVACGVLCALCVLLYTDSVANAAAKEREEALAQYGGDQIEVCVAAHDIAAGETIDTGDVEIETWLVDFLPEGAITQLDAVVGKQASSPVYAGEVYVSRRFSALATSFEVPAGKVAVSVSAKEVQAVGGALTPGAQVDIYSSGNTSTALLASGVTVLATSACASDGSASGAAFTWVALAVDPQTVEELIAAEQKTQLYFALPGSSLSDVPEEGQSDGR